VENENAVTMRGGKTTRDPPYPNHKIGRAPRQQEETQAEGPAQPSMEDEPTPNNYGDTTMLPFPTRERRKKKDGDEQFLRFVEMVEKDARQCTVDGYIAYSVLLQVHQGHHQREVTIAIH